MSTHLELHTQLALPELVRRLGQGRLGSIQFTPPIRVEDGSEFVSKWENGNIRIWEEPDKVRDYLLKGVGIRPETTLWFTLSDSKAGNDDCFKMASAALIEWEGDLAFSINSNDLYFVRKKGQLALSKDALHNDFRRSLFKQHYTVQEFPGIF